MSIQIYEGKDFLLTQFYGGVEKGISIQITKGFKYVQFDKKELKNLIRKLDGWLKKQETNS